MVAQQLSVIVLVIVGGLVLISPIFLAHAVCSRMACKVSARFAARAGLDFRPRADDGEFADYAGVTPFAQGRSRSLANLMSGRWGARPVVMLEHCYLMGQTNSRQYVWQEVAIFPDAVWGLPDLLIYPRGLPGRRSLIDGPRFAFRLPKQSSSILLAGSPAREDFNRIYEIHGQDLKAVDRIFDDEVVRFFVANRGWYLQVDRGRLIVWDPNWRSEFGWRREKSYRALLEGAARIVTVLGNRGLTEAESFQTLV